MPERESGKSTVFCDVTACIYNRSEYHNETVCTASFIKIGGDNKCKTRSIPMPQMHPGQLKIT